jgi:nondiscriminating glutamyl-tRNA synthetase
VTTPVRTRFAPSPTGALHLGNVRTAALNWLYARKCGGTFVLRIEDTDVERNLQRDGSHPSGEDLITEALDWLGLHPDEAPSTGGPYGPYRQSERSIHYADRADELLASGHAFRCYCSPEELDDHRKAAIAVGDPPGRDTQCRDRSPERQSLIQAKGRPASIRLRVDSGPVHFEDRLKGGLSIDGDDLGDMILVRSDGRATYNFAATVDDYEMKISHIIRGIGHLSNTPKQVLLYRAFGVQPPQFIHIPTVMAPGGGKLSKRAGATSVLVYRDRGYHPDAVLNYLSLLSWSSRGGEEFFKRETLIEEIDLDRIGATDTEIDEDKMTWLSGQHVRSEPAAVLADHWSAFLDLTGLNMNKEDLTRSAEVFAHRARLFPDAGMELETIFCEPPLESEEAQTSLATREAKIAIDHLHTVWEKADWQAKTLGATARDAAENTMMSKGQFFSAIRVAMTGECKGPELGDIAYALGKERTLSRLKHALDKIHHNDEKEIT